MRRVLCKLALNRETCDVEPDDAYGSGMSANHIEQREIPID